MKKGITRLYVASELLLWPAVIGALPLMLLLVLVASLLLMCNLFNHPVIVVLAAVALVLLLCLKPTVDRMAEEHVDPSCVPEHIEQIAIACPALAVLSIAVVRLVSPRLAGVYVLILIIVFMMTYVAELLTFGALITYCSVANRGDKRS